MRLSRGTSRERQRRRDEIAGRLVWNPRSGTLKGTKSNRTEVARICVVDITEGLAGGSRPDIDQVEVVANLITRDIWPAARDAIDEAAKESGLDPQAVRQNLANHGWCDLIVGIIQTGEAANAVVSGLEVGARDVIVRAIMRSSMRLGRPQVVERIVKVLVDKVCSVFFAALKEAAPPLGVLTNEDLLSALRILAVFICPAPSVHVEVRRHALAPLGDDAGGYLTDKTRAHLGQVFADWAPRET